MSWLSRRRILAGGVIASVFPFCVTAQNTTIWTTNYYSVTGANFFELRRSLDQARPWKTRPPVDGSTAWQIEWQFSVVPTAGGCRCGSFSTRTTITTTLPLWMAPTNASRVMREDWARYFKALAQHEAGHAQHGLEAASEQSRRIAELGEDAECSRLKRRINGVAREIVEAFRKRDQE